MSGQRGPRAAGAEIVRRFVELHGRRVSYLTAGDSGPTILLIHGSGVSARSWVNQLRGLVGAVRVVAIDLPGHGESDPMRHASVEQYGGIVANFLDALGTGPVISSHHLVTAIGGSYVGNRSWGSPSEDKYLRDYTPSEAGATLGPPCRGGSRLSGRSAGGTGRSPG